MLPAGKSSSGCHTTWRHGLLDAVPTGLVHRLGLADCLVRGQSRLPAGGGSLLRGASWCVGSLLAELDEGTLVLHLRLCARL